MTIPTQPIPDHVKHTQIKLDRWVRYGNIVVGQDTVIDGTDTTYIDLYEIDTTFTTTIYTMGEFADSTDRLLPWTKIERTYKLQNANIYTNSEKIDMNNIMNVKWDFLRTLVPEP